jgi:hypothetical protein
LNDIKGFHVKPEHVREALDDAKSGPVAEGNVGGGTGMTLFDFKGGIGTSFRRVKRDAGRYTVGVLAQCNFSNREQLLVAGVPVGREIPVEERRRGREKGSIIVVVATDTPLPRQLKRIGWRASHGLARTGSTSGNASGDLFVAFSTANGKAAKPAKLVNEESGCRLWRAQYTRDRPARPADLELRTWTGYLNPIQTSLTCSPTTCRAAVRGSPIRVPPDEQRRSSRTQAGQRAGARPMPRLASAVQVWRCAPSPAAPASPVSGECSSDQGRPRHLRRSRE